jgi:hypothetical protein
LIISFDFIPYLLGSLNVGMNDYQMLRNHRDDLVRKIDFHQKMAFELKENLEEMDYLIETKNFVLAKQKIGV